MYVCRYVCVYIYICTNLILYVCVHAYASEAKSKPVDKSENQAKSLPRKGEERHCSGTGGGEEVEPEAAVVWI